MKTTMRLGVLLCALALLFSLQVPEASAQQRISADVVKRCEKAFLLRAFEDFGKSLSQAREVMTLVEAQAGANDGERDDGRKELLEWYRRYTDWLSGMERAVDADVAGQFSGRRSGAAWQGRYDELEKGYARFSAQLGSALQKRVDERKSLNERMARIRKAIRERRLLVDKVDLELARLLWPDRERNSYREAVYVELTDRDIEVLDDELGRMDESRKQKETLTELLRYERSWLAMKGEDSSVLDNAAAALGKADAPSLEKAYGALLRRYEADVASLRRGVDEIDQNQHAIARSGSLLTLDRLEELSQYYDKMKERYDRHLDWLQGQIGGYQADLAELSRDR